MAIKYQVGLLLLCLNVHLCTTDDSLRGHNQPLGMQREPDGHVEILTSLPTPKEFWQKYLSTSTPVLIKAATSSSPALKLWTDDYLKAHFGSMIFKIEGKTEDQNKPIGNLGRGFDQLSHFLDTYKDRKVYIVSQMPAAMQHDIQTLKFITCGSIASKIRESHLWMSSGATRSRLHSDPIFTMNCLLAGQKDWLFINSKYSKYLSVERTYGIGGKFTSINVDKVDLHKHPDVAKAPWQYANATSGDCLYVPRGYFHQVHSKGSRNIAYTILFDIDDKDFEIFNSTGCDHAKDISLSKMSMTWRYSGFGPMSFGNGAPIQSVNEWIEEVIGDLSDKMDMSRFQSLLNRYYRKEKTLKGVMDILKRWINFDQKYITRQQLLAIPVDACNEIKILEELQTNAENDPNFEAIDMDYDQIRQIAEASIDSTGTFDQEKFINKYKNVGGSDYFAAKFIKTLDQDQDGIVNRSEVQRNLEASLEIYEENVLEDDDREEEITDQDGNQRATSEDDGDQDDEEDTEDLEMDENEEEEETPERHDDLRENESDSPQSKKRIQDEL